MPGFRPFSRIAKPFGIGLKPADPSNFLCVDGNRNRYLAQKADLYANRFEDVCMAEAGTEAAQLEVLNLIDDSLATHHPGLSQTAARRYPAMPIADAGLRVQDDLVLMRRDDTGWRLVAASLCFPSSWNLQEKFGKPLEGIHGPVPMDGKMHERIRRIFDALRPGIPVWRENWSLDADGHLRHDRLESHRNGSRNKLEGKVFVRTEYQTLHKLPQSGDILFTIGIFVRPLTDLPDLPRGGEMLAELRRQYLAMSDEERCYKGIDRKPERFLDWLEKNSSEAGEALA